jgi:molecular chaperone GrpE (heat shock protein)
MRCVRLEAELERETANADAFACAVLELWDRLARAAESGLSDEAFRSEVLSIVEQFRELLSAMLENPTQDTVY